MEGECALLSAFMQKFSFWTQEGYTFPQEVSGFRDGTYPGKECFLGKRKNSPKCPDYLVNETCKLLLAQSSFPSMPHNYTSAAVMVYALNLS